MLYLYKNSAAIRWRARKMNTGIIYFHGFFYALLYSGVYRFRGGKAIKSNIPGLFYFLLSPVRRLSKRKQLPLFPGIFIVILTITGVICWSRPSFHFERLRTQHFLEIIICDDCSSDDSSFICKRISRNKVIDQWGQQRFSPTINTGIFNASVISSVSYCWTVM